MIKRAYCIGMLLLLLALTMSAQEELCMDGVLLFREDFGGNDPNDPAISRTPVQGMSSGYQQIYKLQTSDSGAGMGAGTYLVAKRGYRNSTNANYSVWHIMDDHTHFGDTTRGYLLEIDGKGSGNDVFYSTVIDGLCAGSRLTFSAYVANLTTAGQYNAWRNRNYVHPKLSFVLSDPITGTELSRYNTDTISHDWNNYPKSWQETADWQLVGMNFTVPEGIDAVRLSIRNNASGSSTGNDFALDDIEIRLCMPKPEIVSNNEVCLDSVYHFAVEFANDGTLTEPLEYKWWFSSDSLTWVERTELNGANPALAAVQAADSGWYQVAVAGAGNIESVNCRTMSDLFLLHVKDCTPPVTIVAPDSVCPNTSCTLQISITDEDRLPAPLQYQWWYRSPEYPTLWRTVGGNTPSLLLRPFQTQHVGWYKIRVAQEGHIYDEANYIESDEVFVTFKKCEPDLCMDGTLLYKDDFGGNDPNDPRVGNNPVPGMSYQQLTNDRFGGMSSGRYLITKSGYCNGDTASYHGNPPTWGSQWILQDDHTYMDDYSRGYFVEIDGAGGESPFYSTTIHDLCPGTQLVFSAYVVNVHFYEQVQKFFRQNRTYVYPRMKFVLKNPATGDILAQQSTGDIQPDVTKAWNIYLRESAEWQHVGMNFTVPAGVESIQMFIYNDAQNGTGNDFAMDDIEIRLCMPKPTITSDSVACKNNSYMFQVDFTNDGTLTTPLEYQWYFSPDSLNWSAIEGATMRNYAISALPKGATGWYRLAISGAGNIGMTNCRAMSEPFHLRVEDCPSPEPDLCMDGTLLFREDFGGNDPSDPRVGQEPVTAMTYNQLLDDYFGIMRSGSYLLTKQGYCNGDTSITNLPQNRGSQWHLQDDHTYPNDVTRGYLLEIDGRGDNAVFYAKTLDGLCAGSKLTFSAYVANVMTWGQYVGSPGRYAYPRLKFVLRNPFTTETLASYDTGDIPFDSTYMNNYKAWQFSSRWRLVGMSFTVPEGVEAVTLSISNNTTAYTGNDFALDDIEIRLCLPTPTIISENEVCQDSVYTFDVDFTNDGTLTEPLEYKWWHSTDSITWTEMQGLIGKNPTIETFQPTDTGWYKVAVSGAGNIENTNCRSVSEPFHLRAIHCAGPITYVTRDTTVCDTLMPFTWRGMLFDAPGSQTTMQQNQWGFDSCHTTWTLSTQVCCPDLHYATHDTTVCDTLMPFTWNGLLFSEPGSQTTILKDNRGCDTLHTTWTLSTQVCCPDLHYATHDTTVCDTLMPFTWHGLLYNEPGSQTTTLQDDRGCDTLQITWTLSLTPCERPIDPPEPPDPPTPETLYPIIVNKYNWQLLCDNVALRSFFPGRTATAFQWFKNESPVEGATDDDYAEQNELYGVFQLRVLLDGTLTIWSNIIEILDTEEPQEVVLRIYNNQGMLIGEEQIEHGIYLFRYQRGDRMWTEKRLIP